MNQTEEEEPEEKEEEGNISSDGQEFVDELQEISTDGEEDLNITENIFVSSN